MTSLPQLKLLLERATPGEWFVDWSLANNNPHGHTDEGHQAVCGPDPDNVGGYHIIICWTTRGGSVERHHNDARVIAALHNAAPELIAKAEENAALRAECNHLDGQIHELLNENAILSKTVETLRAELELQYQALAMRSGELQTAQSRLRAAEEALRKAADQFEMYAQLHQAKGEAGKEKALVNWRMEVLCRSALTEQEKA